VLNPPRFWVRTLLVAGGDLTSALTSQFGVGTPEAETVKRRVARSGHKARVLRILQPVFEDLANEVQRSLGYYKSLARDVKFDRVLALGGTMELPGLTDMLAASLQCEVKTIRDLSRIRFAPSLERDAVRAAVPGFCPALGLLVQGAGDARLHINMVPEELAMAGAVAAKKPWLLAAAVAVLIVAVILSVGEQVHAQEVARANQGLDFQAVQRAEDIEKQFRAQAEAVQSLENKLNSLARAEIPRDLYLHLLPAFAEMLPPDVYLVAQQFSWVEPMTLARGLSPIADWGTATRRYVAVAGGASTGGGRSTGVRGALVGDEEQLAFAAEMARLEEERGRQMVAQQMAEEQAARDAGYESMAPRGRSGPEGPRTSASSRGTAGPRGPAAAAQVEPVSSLQSRLVLRFVCESKQLDPRYIETQVFENLRKAQFPDDAKPAFTEVVQVGSLINIYRDEETLARLDEAGDGVQRFAGFEGYAIVNVGPAGQAVQEDAAAETTTTRRRRR